MQGSSHWALPYQVKMRANSEEAVDSHCSLHQGAMIEWSIFMMLISLLLSSVCYFYFVNLFPLTGVSILLFISVSCGLLSLKFWMLIASFWTKFPEFAANLDGYCLMKTYLSLIYVTSTFYFFFNLSFISRWAIWNWLKKQMK